MTSIKDLSTEDQLSFIIRVFKAFDDIDSHSDLWWRANEPQHLPVTLLVNCNDLFHWACADSEEITPSNIEMLESTFREMVSLDNEERRTLKPDKSNINDLIYPNIYASILFCCRSRGMRPQKPYYKSIPVGLHPLFDACGPERDE